LSVSRTVGRPGARRDGRPAGRQRQQCSSDQAAPAFRVDRLIPSGLSAGPHRVGVRWLSVRLFGAFALGAAALMLAACGGSPGRAGAPRSVVWLVYRHLPGVVDLAGPRGDGSFLVAAAGRLFVLGRDGMLSPFARGAGGYLIATGTEPYLVLAASDAVRGTSCSFGNGTAFALEPGVRPGVVMISPQGRARRFASLPPGRSASGIAFDRTGRFGHGLLVTAVSGGRTTVFGIGCDGRLSVIAAGAPAVEGGSPWRRRPSAGSAATLSPRTRPVAGCTPWTRPGRSSPWRSRPCRLAATSAWSPPGSCRSEPPPPTCRSFLAGQQAPRRQRHLAAVRGATGPGQDPGRRPAHRHRRRRQDHRHPLHGRVHHPVRCRRVGDRARRRAHCLRIVVKTPDARGQCRAYRPLPASADGDGPDEALSYGVGAADRPASRHHPVGCLQPQRHRQPDTHVPAAGADELIPVAHAGRHHRERIQSSASGRSSPTSILSARSPIRRMPATCMSHFHRPRTSAGDRLVHRAAGGYRPVHVHQHPTGPLQVQAKRLFSRFLVSHEARHDGSQNPLWRWVKTPPTAVASTWIE
jgi:hypothetical protein